MSILFICLALSVVYRIYADGASNNNEEPTTTELYFSPRFSSRIQCAYGKDCVVDCSTRLCARAWIFAVDALSLMVICNNSKDGCNGALINCPMPKDAKCIVECSNHNEEAVVNGTKPGQCQSISIQTIPWPHNGALHVQCEGTHSCKEMDVFCPSDAEHKCAIECNSLKDEYDESNGACSEMNIHSKYNDTAKYNFLDLHCDERECNGLQFHCWDEYTVEHNTTIQTDLTYNEEKSEYECTDDKCCPSSIAVSKISLLKDSDTTTGNSNDQFVMIILIVMSALFIMVCLFAGYWMIKLHKRRMMKSVDLNEDAVSAPFTELTE